MKYLTPILLIILIILLGYSLIKKNEEIDLTEITERIDSLKLSYQDREVRIDTLKIKEKTIYKTIVKNATTTILRHELEHLGNTNDTLPHCDTLTQNYAKTITHLNNVIEQRNELDTAFTDCKETVNLMEQVDSIKTVNHQAEVKRLKGKGLKWFGVGFVLGGGFGLFAK